MNTSARTSRRNWKAYVIGAATAAALLASTACSPNEGEGPDNDTPSGSPTAPSSQAPSPSASASRETPKPGDTPSAKPTPAPTKSGGDGALAPCTEGNVSITASSADDPGEPVVHVLFTIENTGGKTCAVYHYPHVQLGNARGLVPDIKLVPAPKDPFATLAPGKVAYAAMVLSGPMDEAPTKSITVQLQDRTSGSKIGKPIKVAMPGVDTLYFNDFVRVTHWTTDKALALRFIMVS
ncbi:DUF4232 domain-containing protein [Streptomyces sp. 5.8]|uniref:DUF4232 domain-containing protein n=1 Tax=Streptomyces sp. 5.8 TaxID=3406571 RepID=UPI003BB7A6E3